MKRLYIIFALLSLGLQVNYTMSMEDTYKVECINSCNDAAILVIEDLTNSIDNIDWESIIKEASS